MQNSRSGRVWILLALMMLVPAFIGSIVFFISTMIAPYMTIALLPEAANRSLGLFTFVLLIVMNVALYVVVQLVTIGLAANSILREKSGHTWESLLLTNVDARQLVFGKWWATVRALWGDQLMVALLRIGLVGWAVQRFAPSDGQALPIVLLALTLTVFTLLDAAFSAAVGVFSPLSHWSWAITSTMLLSMRVIMTLVGLLWFTMTFVWLMDNRPYMLLAVGGLLVYLLAILGVLRLAQTVAVRGQVSPPEMG